MHDQPKPSPAAAELRRRAEARLREQHPERSPDRTEADTRRLLHELQVHQVELEMQNEELRHARDAMEGGLEKYSDLYDFAPVGYLSLDRDGTIQEANLAAASLLGIERSRLVQRRFGSHVSREDAPAFNAFLTKVFENRVRQTCEVALLTEGKTPSEVRIEAALAASGRECRAVLEDITERKRAEQDRLVLNKLESTGILAGGIAHDFNNLLAVILLNLELAQRSSPSSKELAHLLEAAKKAAFTARDLTQQLITFAKGYAPLRKPTPLPAVIHEFVRSALSGSRVRFELSLAEDLRLAEVDAGQIGQVIRNLALNAREAMPQGGLVSVRAENADLGAHEHPSLPPGEYVRVSLADRGEGIAKEVLPKIFDPYFSTKQRGDQKGMGLGLTICHTIIQKHGGAIAVESEVGVGTTFHLLLPASRSPLAAEPAPVPKGRPRPGKILVMDDEEGVRDVVGMLLEGLGQEVERVAEGRGAIAAFEKARDAGRPFDAVILDLTIRGGMGGQEAIQALLRIDPAVKAVVMSGYADDPVVLEPERHGFRGVLTKPFVGENLREILVRLLGPSLAGPRPGMTRDRHLLADP